MNLFYSLLEKERRRRENAEKTVIRGNKQSTNFEALTSKRQSSQDIQVLRQA